MTGMQPARIAGEMIREGGFESGIWRVNAHSGRYSRDYATAVPTWEMPFARLPRSSLRIASS